MRVASAASARRMDAAVDERQAVRPGPGPTASGRLPRSPSCDRGSRCRPTARSDAPSSGDRTRRARRTSPGRCSPTPSRRRRGWPSGGSDRPGVAWIAISAVARPPAPSAGRSSAMRYTCPSSRTRFGPTVRSGADASSTASSISVDVEYGRHVPPAFELQAYADRAQPAGCPRTRQERQVEPRVRRPPVEVQPLGP